MIGGFSIVPYRFKDCKNWLERLLWILVIVIGFFIVVIPNWFDKIFRRS